MTHTVKDFSVVNVTEVDAFFVVVVVVLGIPLLSLGSSECWQFDFWLFCLF